MKGGRTMSTNISPEVINDLAATVPKEFAGPDEPVYLGKGFDVVVYRWGERTLRFPVRREAVELIENEYRWIPDATRVLREAGFAVPSPRFRGNSSNIFDYPWIIVDYVDGDPLSSVRVGERSRVARDLAVALAALHQPAPAAAPINPCRGVSLAAKSSAFDTHVTGSPHEKLLRARFQAGCDAEHWAGEPVWCHGDPHPANIITTAGRFVGLIDYGKLGQGDPAVDYAAFYLGFTAEQREDARVVLRAMGAPDDVGLWQRAEGWAAYITASLLACDSADLRGQGEESIALLAGG